jgi:choline kinase
MDLVLLAAGASTRYGTTRPKYWLTMYDGRFMIEHVIEPFLDQVSHIHVVTLEEHEKWNVSKVLKELYGDKVSIYALTSLSSGPAESAAAVLQYLNDGPVFIKDCDSIFNVTLPQSGNFVCVQSGHHNPNKSYVSLENNLVTDIVEKSVISDTACIGGYGFASSREFIETLKQVPHNKELFISDVVKQLLPVDYVNCDNFADLGTIDDFVNYNRRFTTIFCDIDGTIIKNQAEFWSPSYNDPPEVLEDNVAKLIEMQTYGAQIIFTTARNKKYTDDIALMLDRLGFKNYTLLTGLNHSQRVVINDFSHTNPAPSCRAVNLPRDSDTLRDYL